jgi:hypothetical protein
MIAHIVANLDSNAIVSITFASGKSLGSIRAIRSGTSNIPRQEPAYTRYILMPFRLLEPAAAAAAMHY